MAKKPSIIIGQPSIVRPPKDRLVGPDGAPISVARHGASAWLPLFLDFISYLEIDSKEEGITKLVPYGAQTRYLEQICEGLERGIRHFICLKARQLGITTISLAIDLFWLMVHDGIQGAIVTDDDANREKIRILLERYVKSLPPGLRVGIIKHNRHNLVFKNGSTIDYLVAGTRRGKSLGVGRALNFVHATEVSLYGDEQAVEEFISVLAEQHPKRLYMFESTARGYNIYYDMWAKAQSNAARKAFFIGWWSKETYAHQLNSPEYAQWWKEEPDLSDTEIQLIDEVYKKYGHEITADQLSWYREKASSMAESNLLANYPSTEEEAFVMTGSSFFDLRKVGAAAAENLANPPLFKAYRYHLGDEFLSTEIQQVTRSEDAELRIWEEPQKDAVYVFGLDPAFGRSDNKDNHALEIWRCYADKLEQVAEYATSDPETRKVTWVLAHLAGVYRNCCINLELTGPGGAIMQELRHLRQLFDAGAMKKPASQSELHGFVDVFEQVRWYIYNRPDTMGSGYILNWRTNSDNKQIILNQFRDHLSTGSLIINSMPLLEEMKTIIQDGVSIEADGKKKDDRVFSTALAIKAWIDQIRPGLIIEGKTYEKALREAEEKETRPIKTMIDGIISNHFRDAEDKRSGGSEFPWQ